MLYNFRTPPQQLQSPQPKKQKLPQNLHPNNEKVTKKKDEQKDEQKDTNVDDRIIYVLELEHKKIYVGRTTNLENRIEQHKKGKGAQWTKIHKFVSIIESRPETCPNDENITTLKYMDKYGHENVRGGTYCGVRLPPDVIKFIEKHNSGKEDICYGCKDEKTHTIHNCCLLYTSPSPRDMSASRMPSSA